MMSIRAVRTFSTYVLPVEYSHVKKYVFPAVCPTSQRQGQHRCWPGGMMMMIMIMMMMMRMMRMMRTSWCHWPGEWHRHAAAGRAFLLQLQCCEVQLRQQVVSCNRVQAADRTHADVSGCLHATPPAHLRQRTFHVVDDLGRRRHVQLRRRR